MCGIAAVIGLNEASSRTVLEVMIGHLQHRGDQKPVVLTGSWGGLACARLAIVDRPNGNQPLNHGRHAIVFNGEIYNHDELRKELAAYGRRFETNSDTEVLLQGYLAWGKDLLDRIEGMYAFVIVDPQSQEFIAARDPFGIKPLYFGSKNGAWALASEIKSLRAAGCSDIGFVPPGGYLLNGAPTRRLNYDELVKTSPSSDLSIDEAVERTRLEFSDSVLRHMPPDDLPVAVFCSGGIDSSAVLYEAVQACRTLSWDPSKKLKAYSVGTEESEDHRVARSLANELGVPFAFERIHLDQMVATAGNCVRIIESFEPNHIRAGTTSLALAKRVASDGFKVALVGEGADELLGGYEEFVEAMIIGGEDAVQHLIEIFGSQLHRTQLRRVDRTTMAYGIEARIPFLDKRFVGFISRLRASYKVRPNGKARPTGKYILREAYRGRLPDAIVDRRKIPMGEGAGIGDNRLSGPFFENAKRCVEEQSLARLQSTYPEFRLTTPEEAHYFEIWMREVGVVSFAAMRPRTNMQATQ